MPPPPVSQWRVPYSKKTQYAEAENSFKKAIELAPNSADAHTGLANVYNAQKKFDLAAEASANAAKYSAAPGGAGGGSAEAIYNQGVILFNAQKFQEEFAALGDRLRPHVTDVSLYLASQVQRGARILFEGAQGTLLDVDHGTYPFVTSSNCVAGNAAVGSGLGV